MPGQRRSLRSGRKRRSRPLLRPAAPHDRAAGTPGRVLAILTVGLVCLSPLATLRPVVPAAAAPAERSGAIGAPDATDGAQAIPAAASAKIKLPFPAGQTWTVGQGYNAAPPRGSHWNCNPTTLKDAPTNTAACRAHYQYKFSVDLYLPDGTTAGRPVLSPVNGVIRWIDLAYGGMSIDLGDGYAVAFFHTELLPGLAAGQTVRQGQQLATVSPPGRGGNGGWPHVHLTVWQTTDGGNWSRIAVPFTDQNTLDGIDLPHRGESVRDQHRGRTIVSTNTPLGGAGGARAPAAPVLRGPATGTQVRTANPTPTLTWNAVSGATGYQVVLDSYQGSDATSPWLTETAWTTPPLANGQTNWRVRARNSVGTGPDSITWIVYVNPATPPPPPATGGLSATISPASGKVGTTVAINGTGFGIGEAVRIYWDSTSTTPLATVTANRGGAWSGSVVIPAAVRGNHALIARGATTGRQAQRPFGVVPWINRGPIEGAPGTRLVVEATGFGPSEQVRLTWDAASGPVLGTATTNARGSGSVGIAVPDGRLGWHDYTGVGLTSGGRAWGAIRVLSSLAVSPTSGTPGARVAVTVKGFPAGQALTVAWNKTPNSAGTRVCNGTLSGIGSFSCAFTIPAGASGGFPLVATAADGTSRAVTISVAGDPAVSVSPGTGQVGTDLAINVGGFTPYEIVNLSWDGSTNLWLRQRANARGAVSLKATAPYLSHGAHTLRARGAASGKTAGASFSIQPGIALAPAGGTSGATATAYARGFPANSAIALRWSRPGSSTATLCTGRTGATGAFTCSFRVPSGTADTTYDVAAAAGAVSAKTGFLLSIGSSGGAPIRGGTVLGPGTYRVTGTREGLVGGTTASGHRIVPNDRFVSLPACTSSSCPWLRPGVPHERWGVRTECGPTCYVRVTNPTTGSCAVAPVLDVGPWFTLDDWWNPTEVRRLNNVPGTVNILAQGYTGADAARNGLNVGYGIGPARIGISNKGYEVGNRSAIDIGDGTWADLGFAYNDLMRPNGIVVTMLWQSGESPTAAARACGRSLPGTTPTPTPTPTGNPTISLSASSGQVGSTITVTGRGFLGNEVVYIHWDATSTAPRRSIRADAGGAFRVSFVVGPATHGGHNVIARGRTSARQAARTYTITPSLKRTPVEGTVGTRVAVTAYGFGANEIVRLSWDSAGGPALGATRANGAGTATLTIAIPNAGAGWHNYTGLGQASGARAWGAILVKPSLALSPATGANGGLVTATGRGFPGRAWVNVYWNRTGASAGAAVCGGTTTSSGTLSCSFPVPATAARGTSYPVVAVGGASSARATFTTIRGAAGNDAPVSASVLPASGVSGERVAVAAEGFAPDESVAVFWDDRTTDGGERTAGADGRATIETTVPTGVAGVHGITVVGGTTGNWVRVEFTILPSLALDPANGTSGTRVTATAKGFDARASVDVYWNRTGDDAGQLLCAGTATEHGTVTCTGTAPAGAAAGEIPIVAVGGERTATAIFGMTDLTAGLQAVAATATPTGKPTATGTPAATATPTATETVVGTETAPVEATETVPAEPSETATEPPPTETPTAPVEATPTGDTGATEEPNPAEETTPTPEPPTPADVPTEEPAPTATDVPTATDTATETPTPEPPTETPAPKPPTETPTPVPPTETPTPEPPPAPTQRELVFLPDSDTSVAPVTPADPAAATPVAAAEPAPLGTLTAGGWDGSLTYLSFVVEGVAPGTVIDARLILTNVSEVGVAGGPIGVLPGVYADEWTLTYDTAPAYEAPPALALDGTPAYVAWADPWVEVAVDVTGSVQVDGTVTFLLPGLPDAPFTIGSRESGTPPRLVLTVLDGGGTAVVAAEAAPVGG